MPASKKIRIFISRKEEDWAAARRLEKILRLYGPNRLEIDTSLSIPEGTNWREAIHAKLAVSDMLFLLFTDPSAKWDWCLFEVGLFTPLGKRKAKPIICWHTAEHPPPGPLQDLRSVRTEPSEMKTFLEKFYGTNEITGREPPINKFFARDDAKVLEVANKICKELQSASETEGDRFHYNRRLKLTLDPAKVQKTGIPPEAVVEADQMTLEIFGLLDDPPDGQWHWSALEAQMRGQGADECLDELAHAIEAACKGHALNPIEGRLKSLTSQKIYRPNVSWRDRTTEGLITIEVLLVQQPAEGALNVTYPSTEKGVRAPDAR